MFYGHAHTKHYMMQVPFVSWLVEKSIFVTVVSLLERFFFTSSPSDNSPTDIGN